MGCSQCDTLIVSNDKKMLWFQSIYLFLNDLILITQKNGKETIIHNADDINMYYYSQYKISHNIYLCHSDFDSYN